MFIESVASGLVATSIFEFTRKVFSSKSGDPAADELYRCFDKAAEQYCKSVEGYVEGGYANLFIWHEENWEQIYKLLEFTSSELDASKFNKSSICGNYIATDTMVNKFIGHVKNNVAKNRVLSAEINHIKLAMENNKKLREIQIKLDKLNINHDSDPEYYMPGVKHKSKIYKENLEIKIAEILDSSHGLSWIENDFFQSSKKLLLELAVNSFYYGGASECTIKIDGKKFIIEDDGSKFNVKHEFLHNADKYESGGGLEYFKGFLSEYSSYVSVVYFYENEKNRLELVFNNYDKLIREHCLISVNQSDLPPLPDGIVFLEECDRYYINAGSYRLTSKAFRVLDVVLSQLPEGKQLVVSTADSIERKILKERYLSDPRVIVEG